MAGEEVATPGPETRARRPERVRRAGVPRPRDAEKTKAAILRAARDEFCAEGFNGARVDAIAARAKANKRLLYHYFGNKEAMYSAVLLDAYSEIRRGEQELTLSRHAPIDAMDRLVRFTFRHFLANPWFPRLLAVENQQHARFLKRIKDLPSINSPVVEELRDILERGRAEGVFRTDVDPLQLYISIASLGYFYVSNMQTLSVVFGRDLSQLTMIQEREAMAAQMVLDYLQAGPGGLSGRRQVGQPRTKTRTGAARAGRKT
jgi:AcrR family transcriptional regulator